MALAGDRKIEKAIAQPLVLVSKPEPTLAISELISLLDGFSL